jgi:hypothetical protein
MLRHIIKVANCDGNKDEPPQDKEENGGKDGNNVNQEGGRAVAAKAKAVVPSPTTALPSTTANPKTPSLWDQLEESSSNNPSLHNFDDLIIPSVNHLQATNYLRESFCLEFITKQALPARS